MYAHTQQTLLTLLAYRMLRLSSALMVSATNLALAKPQERMLERADWQPRARADTSASHTLLFAVKQRNVANGVLTERLMAVSDPDSPTYGQHLTFDQVGDLTADSDATRCTQNYLGSLRDAEIVSITPHGDFVRASASVGTWEAALGTTFYQFHHHEERNSVLGHHRQAPILRTLQYTMPKALAACVEFVGYTTQLPGRVKPQLTATPIKDDTATLAGNHVGTPSGKIDPPFLNNFYNVDSNTGSAKVSQAVFEAVDANYSPEDLSEWLTYYSFPDQKVARDIGGHNSSAECKTTQPVNCIEANLDLQYLMGMAQGPATTYWYEANETWPFIAWIEAVMADPNPVTVHSISYDEPEYHVPASLKDAFAVAAQKLGLMGTSILVSSGDDGVAGAEARQNKTACGFEAYFPAACPYVTAVGATQGPENYEDEIPETADQGGDITSGGGFSSYYPQPAYQAAAVQAYVSKAPMPMGKYNTSMRAYPDVSLLGHQYLTMIGGTQFGVSGTSASTPAVAGMINLINSKRLKAGKSLIGFANPLIYKNPSVFNDMTTGDNRCCAGARGSAVCCDAGFHAIAGWDPVTGFGSMDFAKAVRAFL